MKITKQHILIGLLSASLLGNLFQFLHLQAEREYSQLGRNLVTSEQKAINSKIALGSDCQTNGAIQAHPGGVFSCVNKEWHLATCAQPGSSLKDDFGAALSCDGANWQVAANR